MNILLAHSQLNIFLGQTSVPEILDFFFKQLRLSQFLVACILTEERHAFPPLLLTKNIDVYISNIR